ncbi:MAG: aspartate aminotransferase family protein, partial [Planctomycetes bacterium]|nr:aspartate aminotransferase family protein [Planctomycetota bacterium]
MTLRDKALHNRNAPIDMTPDVFREAGHRLVDDIAEFMASTPKRPVNYDESPSQIRALLPEGPIPNKGTAPDELMREVAPLLFDHSLLNGHPRFLAYITSSPAPIGVLADMLSASVNPNVGGWQLSPMASEIEKQCVTWIAELIGFPKDAGGLFVSGGNMANFAGFLAARQAKAVGDVRTGGL